MSQEITEANIYGLIGEAGLRGLAAAFYRRVATDPVLGPMYPKHDLAAAERRLGSFLIQRFGGPDTYSRERGHPRLRMRHAPFSIGNIARNRWMALMTESLDEARLKPSVRALLHSYFLSTANFMINTD